MTMSRLATPTLFALLAATSLAVAPARAAPPAKPAQSASLAQMNAASQAWANYADLSSRNQAASVDLIAAGSLAHFGFLRDVALHGSAEQVRRVPIADRILVYALRISQEPASLADRDARSVTTLAIEHGWAGVARRKSNDEPLPLLVYVTLVDANSAVGEFSPPAATHYNFGPTLVRERGTWKVVTESLVVDESASITRQVQQSGLTEDAMVTVILARLLARSDIPGPFLRDRPPLEDAVARARLNEAWPDYATSFRTRTRAVQVKAENGDSLAQMVVGSMMYAGSLTSVIPHDREQGLSWLEKAADAGSRRAAELAVVAMGEIGPQPTGSPASADWMARYVRYVRLAADGGSARAMAQYASLLFNGAGGLERDCGQAVEWAQRAEDSGIVQARNDRVWYLATCPLPAQRDRAQALRLVNHMMERRNTLVAGELDTVAAALAANQRYDEAIDYQQSALAALPKADEATRKRMQARLDTYRGGHDWVQQEDQYMQDVP